MDRRGVRRGADRYRVRPGGQTARRGKNVREGRWLKRLLVFLALLDLGLLARNYFPAEAAALRTRVLGERDFKAVFADLGRALDQEGGVAETFAAFWGASAEPTPTPTPVPTPPPSPTPTPTSTPIAMPPPTPTPTPVPTPEPTPTPTPEPTSYPYDGPPPPYNATMAYDPLELPATLDAPVSGGYTSGYGWREHPVDGGDNFHHGVDISSPEGTEIHAFADGVVEVVGKGESYGNYIQIKHSDTVKTLYAHCSKLLKAEGDEVKMGDTIALVGSTGNVTGPHLHFEVKANGLWHDPTYYLELP